MSTDVYDAIVVGAGVEGSACAYNLVKNGVKTLMLEQFPLPHSRGSSHGQSRITRKAYASDFYVNMMGEAFDMMEVLEQEAKEKLYKRTEGVVFSRKNDPFTQSNVESFKKRGLKYEVLSSKKCRERYPQLNYSEDLEVFVDPCGGILRADKVLQAFRAIFRLKGGELRDGEEVVNILPGDVTTVVTSKRTYRTKNVVLAVGPWAPKFFKLLGVSVPLKVERILVLYWKEKIAGTFSSDKTPVFILNIDSEPHVYGLPADEYPGHVKVCLHTGPEIDPSTPSNVNTDWVIKQVSDHIERYLPGLESRPSVIEQCIYTRTKDDNFIIDRHPLWKNIIFAVGFSGHGFKLSPVIGKLVTELVMKKEPSYDCTPFKLNRFEKSKL